MKPNSRLGMIVWGTAIALGGIVPSALAADVQMFGSEFAFPQAFHAVDVSDGSLTAIGTTGGFLAGMDISPSGVLYAGSTSLNEVDPATGMAANTRTINFIGGPGSDILAGLSFSPSGELFGIGNGNGNLWRIDLSTADAEFIGSSGNSIFSLEFAGNGVLYGAGFEFFTVSTMDGSAASMGSLAGGALLTGLDFAPNGVMYGVSSQITTDSLYSIDLDSGVGSLIGFTGGNLVSLVSIPEPSTSVLLGLGGLAWWCRRRIAREALEIGCGGGPVGRGEDLNPRSRQRAGL